MVVWHGTNARSAAMAKRPDSIAPHGRWFNLSGVVFPFYFQGYVGLPGRALLRMGLYEDNLVATPDLIVAGLFQCGHGHLPVLEMLFPDASRTALVAPFPNQGPALEQVLLQVQVVEAGRLVTLGRDLHVNAHMKSAVQGNW